MTTSPATPATSPAPVPTRADGGLTSGPKYPRGPRKDRTRLRLTDDEWTRFQARVRETGRTPGRYLRELALGTVPRVRQTAVHADAVRELTRVGITLNQLARAANSDNNAPLEARIDAVLEAVLATIDQLAESGRDRSATSSGATP